MSALPRSVRPEWARPVKVPTPVITLRPEPKSPAQQEIAEALLLCLDLQPAFLASIPEKPLLLARCSFALEAAAGLGLPVLFTEQVPAKLGGTWPDLLKLGGRPEVFGKNVFSALGDEKTAARIRAGGVKRLFLCGIETPICVFQTAQAALAAGLEVTVLSDCIGARRSNDAATALDHLAKSGCSILPVETVFYSLIKSASHPFFRPFTALVKKYG